MKKYVILPPKIKFGGKNPPPGIGFSGGDTDGFYRTS
jgi:hypothetical protein